MNLTQVLQSVDLFEELAADEIEKVACICSEKRFSKDQIITKEGEQGNELYIITEGFMEVLLGEKPSSTARVVDSLGSGQVLGEMALLDQGPRSASLKDIREPTILQVNQRANFENLCQENTHIGYIVMRNLATDLSFKLRHRNLDQRQAVCHGHL